MMWLDIVGGVSILVGALLCAVAAVGLHRLPDSLGRMHAASKPQTLGIAFAALGLALVLRDPAASGMLVLVGTLQLLTAPVASQMIARSAFRTKQYREDSLEVIDGADRPSTDEAALDEPALDEPALDETPGGVVPTGQQEQVRDRQAQGEQDRGDQTERDPRQP